MIHTTISKSRRQSRNDHPTTITPHHNNQFIFIQFCLNFDPRTHLTYKNGSHSFLSPPRVVCQPKKNTTLPPHPSQTRQTQEAKNISPIFGTPSRVLEDPEILYFLEVTLFPPPPNSFCAVSQFWCECKRLKIIPKFIEQYSFFKIVLYPCSIRLETTPSLFVGLEERRTAPRKTLITT